MSRTYYQIYKEQTFVLARTLIVKHEEIASSMNTELYYRGYTVDSNPYNWRYYLNLSGEYHQADKDELYEKYGTQYMMVKIPSLLGSVDVPLTKELLHGVNADKTMMNEYQTGSKFYEELVSRYPEFESLIIGIINPIEKEVALAADNGEILFIAGRYKRIKGDRKWFDTTWYSINEILIEEQEDNLILELQRYINHFLKHWSNPEYVNGNDLYIVTMLGILYANIPNALFNIRLGNCKTARAHTFHIRQYLESFGQIGRYVDFIPIGTILWLYKNVHYLEANAGKQHAFDLIMDNMLTPNEIPMSAYTARHELSNLDYDNPLPNTMLYKEVLNFSIVGASDDDRTVLDILEDQKDLARDNVKDLDEKAEHMQDALNWGGDDRLNTKVLESEMIDIGEPYPFTLSQMLFNHWGYTSIKGYYTGTAYATNPLTGDRLSFSSKNAYILAMYCLNKAVAGVELERVPSVRLYDIPRTDQPDDYPTDKRFHKKPDIDKMMSWCVAGVTRRLKVLEVRGTHIPTFLAQDSEQFFANTEEIYHERIRRYNTYCDVENLEERGDLELVAKRLYWMGFEEKIIDVDYVSWFRTIGFDVSRFTDTDLLGIGLELVASATGVSEQDDVRKKWLQKSLLAILKHFVSYTVHVIEKYTDGVVAYLEGQTLRFSNFEWTYTEPVKTYYNVSLDYKTDTLIKQAMRIDVSNAFENTKVTFDTKSQVSFDMSNFEITQRAHRLASERYILGTKIFNIEFNTEKSEPVYITVIDESINTIVIHSVFGHTHDDNFIHVLKPDVSYVKPYHLSGRLKDLNASAHFYDSARSGVTIEGSYADVSDGQYRPKDKHDTGVIAPHAMFATTQDASITGIGFVDAQTLLTKNIQAGSYYVNDTTQAPADNQGVSLNFMSASLKDASAVTQVNDTDMVAVRGMQVGFMDPAIPTVVLTPDSEQAIITGVQGLSHDTTISLTIVDSSVLVLDRIDMVSPSEEQAPLNLSDPLGAQVQGIQASLNDTLPAYTLRDIATISIGTLSLGIVDSVDATLHVIDDHVLDTSGIHATVVDNGDVDVVDAQVVDIGIIIGQTIDESISTTTIDLDTLMVSGISASSTDIGEQVSTTDSTTAVVTGVSMSYQDHMDGDPSTSDDTTVIVSDIQLSHNDTPPPLGGVTSDHISIRGIHARIKDESQSLSIRDLNYLTPQLNMVEVDVIDEPFLGHITDDSAFGANQGVQGSIRDATRITTTVDRHSVIHKPIKLGITGDSTRLSVTSVSTAVMVPSGSVGVSLVNYTYVTVPADATTVLNTHLSASVKDINIKLEGSVDGYGVKVNLTHVNLHATDSDTMLDDTDKSVIGITGIQLKLVDESDDSKPKP